MSLGLAVAVAATLVLLGACVTRPAPQPSVPVPVQPAPPQPPRALTAQIVSTRSVAPDLDTVVISAQLELSTEATSGAAVRQIDVELSIAGVAVARSSLPVSGTQPGVAVSPGDADSVPIFPLHVGQGGTVTVPLRLTESLSDAATLIPGLRSGNEADYTITVRVHYAYNSNPQPVVVTETSSTFPIIQRPQLRITEIRIEQWQLVNTKLQLTLSVFNPNVFPVRFGEMRYRLYGEDMIWADGAVTAETVIPPTQTVDIHIPVEMDFIETGRGLYDLVDQLQVISYRLNGAATVKTGLQFLPEFSLPFDLRGRQKVER